MALFTRTQFTTLQVYYHGIIHLYSNHCEQPSALAYLMLVVLYIYIYIYASCII